MPLLTSEWDAKTSARFVARKEECWARDGLGHRAILPNDKQVSWGGFQKEGDEWDFGLVLTSDAFGLGRRVTNRAIDVAVADERIPFVTFLMPPSRKIWVHLKDLVQCRLARSSTTEKRPSGFVLRMNNRQVRKAVVHPNSPSVCR